MTKRDAAVVVAAALAALAAAAPAAGTYTVHACSTPDGTPASLGNWVLAPTVGNRARASHNCGDRGGAIALRRPAGNLVPGDAAMATFTAPPNTLIQQATLVRSFTGSANPHVFWRAFVEGAPGEECVGRGGCGGLPRAERVIPGRGRTRLALQVFCGAIVPARCDKVPAPVEGRIERAAIELSDDAPPSFAEPPAGALVQPRAEVAGVQEVTAALRDNGGGLRLAGGAGVPIQPLERVARRGAAETPAGAAVTANAQGRFSARIGRGPSRTLRFGYRRGPNDTTLACSAPLRLRVRAPVTLSAAKRRLPARRQRAALSGRVRGGFIPRRGVRVNVQAFENRRWQTFESRRTDRRGRFRVRVPFSGRRGTFRLRAVVPTDSAYPFALGRSKTVRVRVG